MSEQIPLHELNKHLFAALMPETHGEPQEAKPKRKAKAEAPEAAPATSEGEG